MNKKIEYIEKVLDLGTVDSVEVAKGSLSGEVRFLCPNCKEPTIIIFQTESEKGNISTKDWEDMIIEEEDNDQVLIAKPKGLYSDKKSWVGFIQSILKQQKGKQLNNSESDFVLQYLDVIVEHLKKKRPENIDRIDKIAMGLKDKLSKRLNEK